MTRETPSVMIVAGEASGDLNGAHLAANLRRLLPNARISGVGGRRMQEAGVELISDSSSWGAIGIAEAIKLVPRLLLELRKLRRRIQDQPPDVLVLIDFGAFNVRLARGVRPSGVKIVYYYPPGSWKRGATYANLDGIVDRVVTPFPWSVEALTSRGFQADFFGHPLLDIVKPDMPRDRFCREFGLDAGRPIVGLLPGSRAHEIAHNMPALLIAASRLLESMPELQFAVPLAPSVESGMLMEELSAIPWVRAESHGERPGKCRTSWLHIAEMTERLAREEAFKPPGSPVRIDMLPGMAYDVLAHSRASVVTSGTATVEAMILGCPMVIIYRGSRLLGMEFKLLGKNVKFIGMPNIILNRMACPELIYTDASPSRIAGLMRGIIEDTPERADMLKDLEEARSVLGEPGAVRKTAEAVARMLGTGDGLDTA